jgi:hypothetical protein
VDFTAEYHDTNYDKTSLRREKGKPILFLFYRIHANYVGSYKFPNTNSKKEVYFAPGDKLYIDVPANFPLITFSVATPLGGLVFETRINNAVAEIVKANTAECEKYFQEIS